MVVKIFDDNSTNRFGLGYKQSRQRVYEYLNIISPIDERWKLYRIEYANEPQYYLVRDQDDYNDKTLGAAKSMTIQTQDGMLTAYEVLYGDVPSQGTTNDITYDPIRLNGYLRLLSDSTCSGETQHEAEPSVVKKVGRSALRLLGFKR